MDLKEIIPKMKEVSEYYWNKIIKLYSELISYRRISITVNVPYFTVSLIIRNFKEYDTTVNLPSLGSPR